MFVRTAEINITKCLRYEIEKRLRKSEIKNQLLLNDVLFKFILLWRRNPAFTTGLYIFLKVDY